MCQLIYLGSVDPLPESTALEVRCLAQPGEPGEGVADVRAVLPDARYIYEMGACQCYFRYFPEEELTAAPADGQPQDKEAADSSRAYLRGRNAYVVAAADYLADNLARTPIWLLWKWEGQAVSPDCLRWRVTPSYFREQDFTMPPHEGVLTVVPEGEPLDRPGATEAEE